MCISKGLEICFPGVQRGYGVHSGYAYAGYGYPNDRYGHPIMPYPHRYVNQPGPHRYNDSYATPDSYQYHMNLANRYDRQLQQQTESQQKSTLESSLKEQINVKSSPLKTSDETNVKKQTKSLRTSGSSQPNIGKPLNTQ